jgi:pyruvate/2-oxoglutarate dehydrogenase complex dihydrolipoamide acyltransferase (E2) component
MNKIASWQQTEATVAFGKGSMPALTQKLLGIRQQRHCILMFCKTSQINRFLGGIQTCGDSSLVCFLSQVEIRPMMYVALTYDHRLIDGREAVLFLKKIKSAVEDPTVMLVDL